MLGAWNTRTVLGNWGRALLSWAQAQVIHLHPIPFQHLSFLGTFGQAPELEPNSSFIYTLCNSYQVKRVACQHRILLGLGPVTSQSPGQTSQKGWGDMCQAQNLPKENHPCPEKLWGDLPPKNPSTTQRSPYDIWSMWTRFSAEEAMQPQLSRAPGSGAPLGQHLVITPGRQRQKPSNPHNRHL